MKFNKLLVEGIMPLVVAGVLATSMSSCSTSSIGRSCANNIGAKEVRARDVKKHKKDAARLKQNKQTRHKTQNRLVTH